MGSIKSTPKSSNQSVEYKTMVKCAPSILDCIKASPNSIGTAMFAKGYISEYVRDIVGSTSVSGVDKAQLLLNTITDRVKTDPLAYNGFVDIIKKEGIWTSCYLDEFQKAYEEPSETEEIIKPMSQKLDRIPKTNQIMDIQHDSYHCVISGNEAEFRLKAFKTRSYLTRYSVSHKQYILSVYQPVLRGNEIKHEMRNFVITFKHDDKKIYQITDREFNSLKEMLETYEREKVDHSLPNIGRMVTVDDYLELRQQQQQDHSFPNMVSYLQLRQQPEQQDYSLPNIGRMVSEKELTQQQQQQQQQQQRDCPKCLIL